MTDDQRFCATHGVHHSMEMSDPDCAFEDGLGSPIEVETAAPSLVAASREAIADALDEATSKFGTGFWATGERDALVDALLAPGGPVQLADATPEQVLAAIRADAAAKVIDWFRLEYAAREQFSDVLARAHKHFGFTRKETGE